MEHSEAAPSRADGSATRAAILRAARNRLVEVGYAKLNVRDIARDAGVNHALISYHFHGKQQLVLAVLDEANKQLLERQTRMYAEPRQRQRQVAAGLRLLRAGPAVRLRAPDDGVDGARASTTKRCAASSCRACSPGPRGGAAVGDFIDRYGAATCRCRRRAITAWIVSFWIGMEAT